MCLQSDPKCYERIPTKFLKYFILANFLQPYSLINSLMCSVKHSGKLATALLLWQKCLEFCGEKPFHNLKCLRVCTVLLQF